MKSSDQIEVPPSFDFGFKDIKNIFVIYTAALFLLAYCLSILVSYLHFRSSSIVVPLTAPVSAAQFTEYVILVKTSLLLGSSLDSRGRVSVQLVGNFGNSPKLILRKGKTIEFFLCRGGVNIFVYHSPTDLGDIVEVEIDVFNDTPYEIPFVQWRPCYIKVLQPVSKKHWGARMSKKMKTEDKITERFPCQGKLHDRNGILKSLCLFHVWLSMFHIPVRLGMYSTIVNVVFVFFMKSMLCILLYFGFQMKGYTNNFVGLVVVLATSVLELILEAFIRNTQSRFRSVKESLFLGLVEPVESVYDQESFGLNYDWDKVQPIVVRKTVVIEAGSKHGSGFSIFEIRSPFSIYNLWGVFNKQEEREPLMILRILKTTALPLPATMKWLAIEAAGRKEETLILQTMNQFESHICLFETWLYDWPFNFAEEPPVAGLIISHIMCVDLLMLLRLEDPVKRARMAQLCVNQWHGLICCLFLYIIKYHLQSTKEDTAEIKNFISHTITQFGKRSPRQIKASWLRRNDIKREFQKGNYKHRDPQAKDNVNASSKLNEKMVSLLSESTVQPVEGLLDVERDVFANPRHVFQDNLLFHKDATKQQTEVKHRRRHPLKEEKSFDLESGELSQLSQRRYVHTCPVISGQKETEDKVDRHRLRNKKRMMRQQGDFNANADLEILIDEEEEYDDFQTATLSEYEKVSLGTPFHVDKAPSPAGEGMYKRHINEMEAFCCQKKRCVLFRTIHQKVGVSCLEVLENAFEDLVKFANIKQKDIKQSNLWERKKMVTRLLSDLSKKAHLYDSEYFEYSIQGFDEGFNSNRLFTSIYTHLQNFLTTVGSQEKANKDRERAAKEKIEKTTESRKIRCIFCAREIRIPNIELGHACGSVDRLAKVLSKGAIFVAEKELNLQVLSCYTIQNFCAMMLCHARDEVRLEIEDPPMVICAQVMQAMIQSLLSELLPRQTDFNELSADELRKIGTRLQRIKARYVTSDEEKNRSREEKKRMEKIKHFLKVLSSRWQLGPGSKSLRTSSECLGQCLVQERLLGLSVYSGFITKDHELVLNGDRERLIEIESKATTAVLKIARKLCEPIVKDIVQGNFRLDIIFSESKKELSFLVEKMVLAQYKAEPMFLATCCYYISDIVSIKVEEFKHVIKYLNHYKPATIKSLIPKGTRDYKFLGQIRLLKNYRHSEVCSPILRWGEMAIKGEPPLTKEFTPAFYLTEGKVEYSDFTEMPVSENDKIIAALIGFRRGMDSYARKVEYDKERQLQHHLAKVQAHLMDQIAEASQSISQIAPLDTNHVSEFHQDQLYNVELYATNKLKLPIATVFGVILLLAMVGGTLAATVYVTIRGSQFKHPELKQWSLLCFKCVMAYGLICQPIKCLLYSIFRLYTDS